MVTESRSLGTGITPPQGYTLSFHGKPWGLLPFRMTQTHQTLRQRTRLLVLGEALADAQMFAFQTEKYRRKAAKELREVT